MVPRMLRKVSTKFSFHEIQFYGECFWHDKTVPSSEQAKTKYSFWSIGCSLTPLVFQGADPMIPIIPHPPEPEHPPLAQECSLCHHSQLQVLACSHITVWALGLRIPTIKGLPQRQKLMFRQVVKHCLSVYMPQLSQNASQDQT